MIYIIQILLLFCLLDNRNMEKMFGKVSVSRNLRFPGISYTLLLLFFWQSHAQS